MFNLMELDPHLLAAQLAWPLTLMLAWFVGEWGQRHLGLPRISFYALTGFLLAATQFGLLPQQAPEALDFVAHLAFGLMLFELGYRVNLQWLRFNPWILAIALVEAVATFFTVQHLLLLFDVAPQAAKVISAIAISTSPAVVINVANELRSSGQVTERMLHLCALNCLTAVLALKLVLGFSFVPVDGGVWQAALRIVLMLVLSLLAGGVFALVLSRMLRLLRCNDAGTTLAFALALTVLMALTYSTRLSTILAALGFGLVARHRRLHLPMAQRNFGIFGDFLALLLFAYVATALEWRSVVEGLGLGLLLIAGRLAVKTASNVLFAPFSGASLKKGVLTGLALTPFSVFAIMLLEQVRNLGFAAATDGLAALGAAILILEIFGPVLTQQALRWAGEARQAQRK